MAIIKRLLDGMNRLFASLTSSSMSWRMYSARAWNEKAEAPSEVEPKISGRGMLVRWRYVTTRT